MKTKYALLLTLGHNSSALVVNTTSGEVLGYEEERLTRVKSDSSFPRQALSQILTYINPFAIQSVRISHWFDSGTFDPMTTENKYWSANYMLINFPHLKAEDYAHTDGELLTHHDAHAYSCLAFTGQQVSDFRGWHVIVMDGFGTDREVLSVYACSEKGAHLVERSRGYSRSLGLLFQYAAEALGMDGINDVYKFLGYQAAADESIKSNELLNRFVDIASREFLNFSEHETTDLTKKQDGSLIDYEALSLVRNDMMGLFEHSELNTRIAAGYVIQQIVERVVLELIDRNGIEFLMVAGGSFYNVKLNNRIINDANLKAFSPMPLAGDQGAAIGVYEFLRREDEAPVHFGDMCWGVRPYLQTSLYNDYGHENFHVRRSFASTIPEIQSKLDKGEIVNIVRRRAEFGPRALCKTSTLAPPTAEHVAVINELNGRNTVMPMAPVMLYENAYRLFVAPTCQIIESNRYMICSIDYDEDGGIDDIAGAALKDHHGYTGRPQIIFNDGDALLGDLLERVSYPCLINTSFNGHGDPIILRPAEAYELHRAWMRKKQTLSQDIPFSTYIFIDE